MTEEHPSLESLRIRFGAILTGLDHPPLGMAAALAEECGEVSKLLLDHHAYGKPMDTKALGSELMDVFVCLCEIASRHGVNLDLAAHRKVEDLSKRAPEWRVLLSEALTRARNANDPGIIRPAP